ncbi:MAG: hypothetical protein WAW92_03605 [Minisyncoccia bacterium]
MTKQEKDVLLRKLTTKSASTEELARRLTIRGCSYVCYDWIEVLPNDREMCEAKMYHRGPWRYISRSGALVTFDLY